MIAVDPTLATLGSPLPKSSAIENFEVLEAG